jgi:hypothetical protein
MILCSLDILSLGDRTMDNVERHSSASRPRQQLLDATVSHKLKPEPGFDLLQSTNVTALVGKTAYLTCRVHNLGDKTVIKASISIETYLMRNTIYYVISYSMILY